MKRDTHGGPSYALSAFFAVTGGVLAVVVGIFALREVIAPRTQTWTVWTTSALALLSLIAIALWIAGAVISSRVHRARRDRVNTFLTADERARVIEAVSRFEGATSGEIRVHLAEHSHGDPTRAAVLAFEQLGMTRTQERNGVLFFVSVRDRHVAVIGDAGIHEKVPDGFWDDVVRAIETQFAEGRFAEGLAGGIEMAGARLAEHFPHRPGDTNELPDSISDDTR
jgi:uncharacterized membrane protein